MKHRWINVNHEGKIVTAKLSDYLHDSSYTNDNANITLDWKKVEHSDASIDYVCYHNDKQVGFVPIDWADDDFEIDNYWQGLKFKGLNTLEEVVVHIMDRYLEKG